MTSDDYAEAWLPGPHSTQFYTRTYLVPGGTLSKAAMVFLHGFTEHIGRYTEVHAEFARCGINVFAYDQRGFGKTALDEEHGSGRAAYGKTDVEKQMDDVEWALTHTHTAFPSLPLFLSGHSMGGGETLNFVVRRPDAVTSLGLRGMIPCSPLILTTSPSPYLRFWTAEKEATGEDPYAHTDTSRKVQHPGLTHDAAYNEMSKHDTLREPYGTVRHMSQMLEWGDDLFNSNYTKWPSTLPILIVHGSDDLLTSHDAARMLIEKLPAVDKKFTSYPDGRHELVHEPAHGQAMVDEIVGFIEGRI
ncbi:Alpha/Beta hydrolase protein [Roridomyces roridus]|uniref:Alpha/Beta hydrolase protein n=1 Tax=Roridomyces roridus TaxID=1738132 RepID=A0AAD7BBX4_9AGAR|nr:Alpha/Beta hydrolase protein [Roridomyces roridus]